MSRRFLSLGWLFSHLLLVAAVLTCLRLGWWQWDRSYDSDGGVQNLGYALLWPAFAAAFIYMYLKFISLEREQAAGHDADGAESLRQVLAQAEQLAVDAAETSPPAPRESESTPPASPSSSPVDSAFGGVGTVGDEAVDGPELIAYNRALAALAEQDHRAR